MRALLVSLLLVSCQAPDRWHTSVYRGEGEINGEGWHDFDEETATLEVGVSGPLGFAKSAPRLAPPELCPAPSAPAQAPADDGLPLEELLYLVIGAGAWKSSEFGWTKYKQRKST